MVEYYNILRVGLSLLLVVVLSILVKPIIWPIIITFPWEDDSNNDKQNDKKNRDDDANQIVILAGSYNPPHLGHLAMLEYLSKRYKQVIAVVGFNPNKKYDVTPEQRKSLLEEMIKNTSRTNIQVEVVEGYIWRYAKRIGATTFFRGIRSWEKDGSDERALQILNTWGPMLFGPFVWPIPTMYLEGNPKYNHVSSTLIRDLCRSVSSSSKQSNNNNNNNDNAAAVRATTAATSSTTAELSLSELVPNNVIEMISNFYCKKDE